MNGSDYFIIAVVFISTLISLMRGFISEAISLLTWVVAAIVAFQAAPAVAEFLSGFVHNTSLRVIIGFLIVFLIIIIIGAVINHFLSVFVLSTGLSGTNRLLGMIFGFARGVLLIAIFILFATYTSLPKERWWHASQLIPYFLGITDWLKELIFTHPKIGTS
jgi:membrane protein required for colicin V production